MEGGGGGGVSRHEIIYAYVSVPQMTQNYFMRNENGVDWEGK